MSKVIERVVHTQLSIHLDQLGYLYKYQYVFRRGHNTQQAIAQFNDWVLEAMDRGKVTGLLFVDISKAFDSLNHKVLLGKLESLRSYLARRRQRVLRNGELSHCRVITHGIPQESILGPLLFNIYVNSLPNVVKNARVILYADDAVLICTAPTSVEAILARDFNWICDRYQLAINVKKTKLMLARSNTMFSLFDDVALQMNGTQVDRLHSCKYPGVAMDKKWSWKPHITNLLRSYNCWSSPVCV